LLTEVGFDRDVDRLFAVGDLIDRGRDSMGCMALLDEPWFHCVRGNHEDMLLTVEAGPTASNRDWWLSHGGLWARALTKPEMTKYADAIRSMPLAMAVGTGRNRFNVVHAEFLGDDGMLDAGNYGSTRQEQMMWGRSLIRSKSVNPMTTGLSTTYVGHTIVPIPAEFCHHVYIDTGCFSSGVLTMIEHATGDCWMTAAHDALNWSECDANP